MHATLEPTATTIVIVATAVVQIPLGAAVAEDTGGQGPPTERRRGQA